MIVILVVVFVTTLFINNAKASSNDYHVSVQYNTWFNSLVVEADFTNLGDAVTYVNSVISSTESNCLSTGYACVPNDYNWLVYSDHQVYAHDYGNNTNVSGYITYPDEIANPIDPRPSKNGLKQKGNP